MSGRPQKFWMVFNSNGRAPKKRHPSHASACAEAERVAARHPGVKCYVLEGVGYFTTGDSGPGGESGPVKPYTL